MWTECAERNPKERGTYLVFSASNPERIRIVNYGTSVKWENGRDKLLPKASRITHWMPLPAPPEQKE